jgi:hypothetical protein
MGAICNRGRFVISSVMQLSIEFVLWALVILLVVLLFLQSRTFHWLAPDIPLAGTGYPLAEFMRAKPDNPLVFASHSPARHRRPRTARRSN